MATIDDVVSHVPPYANQPYDVAYLDDFQHKTLNSSGQIDANSTNAFTINGTAFVKPGSSMSMTEDGTLNCTYSYTLPTATTIVKGGIKVGLITVGGAASGFSMSSDALNLAIPTATSSTQGVVKPGTNMSVDTAGSLSCTYSYTLPTASSTVLGGVMVGSGLAISSGVLSATYSYTLPIASASVLGGIKVGDGLAINSSTGVLSASVLAPAAISSGKITVNAASTSASGVVTLSSSLTNSSSTVPTTAAVYSSVSELQSLIASVATSNVGLQSQIDAVNASQNLVDIVGTISDLQAYDISNLRSNDKIEVLSDSGHSNAATIYRLGTTSDASFEDNYSGSAGNVWSYVGQVGDYYTKSEIDTRLTASPAHSTVAYGSTYVVTSMSTSGNYTTGLLPALPTLSTGSGAAYTSASGNAITGLSVSGHTITCTIGGGFLTSHPTITMTNTGAVGDSSATVSPAHGGSFDVVGYLNRDANGHVTSAIEKTVTLPSETVLSTGSGAAYTSTTGNAITGLAVSGHKITCTVGGNFLTSISGAGADAYLSGSPTRGYLWMSDDSTITNDVALEGRLMAGLSVSGSTVSFYTVGLGELLKHALQHDNLGYGSIYTDDEQKIVDNGMAVSNDTSATASISAWGASGTVVGSIGKSGHTVNGAKTTVSIPNPAVSPVTAVKFQDSADSTKYWKLSVSSGRIVLTSSTLAG